MVEEMHEEKNLADVVSEANLLVTEDDVASSSTHQWFLTDLFRSAGPVDSTSESEFCSSDVPLEVSECVERDGGLTLENDTSYMLISVRITEREVRGRKDRSDCTSSMLCG